MENSQRISHMFDRSLFKRKRMVCLGLLTADMYLYPVGIDSFRESSSDTFEIENFLVSVGGDASNQAIALSQLGADVTLVAKTGDDPLGMLLAGQLAAHGVKTTPGLVEKGRRTSVSLVCVDTAGQRRFLYKKENNNTWGFDEVWQDLRDMKGVFLSIGSFGGLQGIKGNDALAHVQALRENGCTVFADMSADVAGIGAKPILQILSAVDYFLPSRQEAQMLSGMDNPVDAIRFLKRHVAGEVVIKLGSEGCVVSDGKQGTQISAYPVSPVDTTGAGDNFIAGFMCGIACGGNLITAAQFGNIAGALSTSGLGAHVLSYSPEELMMAAKRYYGNEEII